MKYAFSPSHNQNWHRRRFYKNNVGLAPQKYRDGLESRDGHYECGIRLPGLLDRERDLDRKLGPS